MNLKEAPRHTQPAYAWLWNSTVTKEGIDERIEEMVRCGIGAFYVIGEPENWYPERRATHLYPPYLSDEYIELLYYAFEKAEEKGIYTWLYNEGAFPSGCACGLVTSRYPELKYKTVNASKRVLKAGEVYRAGERSLGAFIGRSRIRDGFAAGQDTGICEYSWVDSVTPRMALRVDNACRRGTDEFIRVTHERLKARFGEHMGREIVYMFDDEPDMGRWTENLDRIFYERYGYDLTDYLPVIAPRGETPVTDAEYRALSDYMMLCGELLTENYFIPMRDWLRDTGMQSVGHLNNDDKAIGAYLLRYGNILKMMRAYDVPGVDVIWEQISPPTAEKSGCCFESMEMFPRLASSAARQIGRNIALSESFAVYGSHVTPEQMRFVVNFQAVRGINLFNFMAMSYDRRTPMRHQFRPNFIGDNVGVDFLGPINDYTARLSHILQESRPVIRTALYYPLRTICAGGEKGAAAAARFEELGRMLEDAGVSFDFIDEELVGKGRVENGALICDHVAYENIFCAEGELELDEVVCKLRQISAELVPDLKRTNPLLQTRHLIFPDKSEGYFLFNQSGGVLCDRIEMESDKALCRMDLFTGERYVPPYERVGGSIVMELSLLSGEGMLLLLSDDGAPAMRMPEWEAVCPIEDIRSRISRVYILDYENGVKNEYPDNEWQDGLVRWEDTFSGEAAYTFRLPALDDGEYRLNLGEVRHAARVFVNGQVIGEATMPPYTVGLGPVRGGEEVTVLVANTPANACAASDYFERHEAKDVGPYHARMVISEGREGRGGLFGPIMIERKR